MSLHEAQPNETHPESRRILGLDFFGGSAAAAIERLRNGGLLVVPAAPALKDLATNSGYREALLEADLCITDSAYMVMIWNLMQRDNLRRLSGLEYLRALLQEPSVREGTNVLWIMASPKSAATNLGWLRENGISVPDGYVYMAPIYGDVIADPQLLELLERLRPSHVVVTVGGGTQERLGLYLKRNLSYMPAIHCIGAAIAFLSGDQVNIPAVVDRLYLGWLFRCISEPRRYVPRYWGARKLLELMLRFRSELPTLAP